MSVADQVSFRLYVYEFVDHDECIWRFKDQIYPSLIQFAQEILSICKEYSTAHITLKIH